MREPWCNLIRMFYGMYSHCKNHSLAPKKKNVFLMRLLKSIHFTSELIVRYFTVHLMSFFFRFSFFYFSKLEKEFNLQGIRASWSSSISFSVPWNEILKHFGRIFEIAPQPIQKDRSSFSFLLRNLIACVT